MKRFRSVVCATVCVALNGASVCAADGDKTAGRDAGVTPAVARDVEADDGTSGAVRPAESGPQDSGPQDSGPQDSGPQDSGPQDSGPQDGALIDTAAVRAAVQQSVPYIAARGQWWIDKKKCISCHRTTFSIWAVASAQKAGLQVDRGQLEEWVAWSYESMLQPNDDGKIVATTNLDGAAQLLHVTRGLPADENRRAQQQQLSELLQQGQQSDGSWLPAGQLPAQKRPKAETTWVSTAWIDFYTTDDELPAAHHDRAAAFLSAASNGAASNGAASSEAAQPDSSTEAVVMRLLLADESARADARSVLLNDQRADGGWGWIRGQQSDAMATGQALWALAYHNDPQTEVARQRAVTWLLSQQQEDRWQVKGTKKNKQHRVEETATYWGTCWAVIGLLEAAGTVDTAE